MRARLTKLKDVDTELNSTRLRAGTLVEATLQDRIVFHNDSELDLLDLRRHTRALGGDVPTVGKTRSTPSSLPPF